MKLAYQISGGDVPLEIGTTSYHGPLEHCFRRLRECGYDGAELMVRDPAAHQAAELERLSRQYAVELPMICTGEIGGAGLFFSSLDDGVRDQALARAKQSVDLAAALGAQINVGRLRGPILPADPQRSRARSVEALRALCAYAGQRGVLVAIEPINSIVSNFINTTRQGLDFLEELGCESARLMLDLQHMFLDDRDLYDSIRRASGQFSYIHITDSNRCYPGTGSRLLDLGRFVETLYDCGYDGYLTVEILQRPDQETALEESMRALRPLLDRGGKGIVCHDDAMIVDS